MTGHRCDYLGWLSDEPCGKPAVAAWSHLSHAPALMCVRHDARAMGRSDLEREGWRRTPLLRIEDVRAGDPLTVTLA